MPARLTSARMDERKARAVRVGSRVIHRTRGGTRKIGCQTMYDVMPTLRFLLTFVKQDIKEKKNVFQEEEL